MRRGFCGARLESTWPAPLRAAVKAAASACGTFHSQRPGSRPSIYYHVLKSIVIAWRSAGICSDIKGRSNVFAGERGISA